MSDLTVDRILGVLPALKAHLAEKDKHRRWYSESLSCCRSQEEHDKHISAHHVEMFMGNALINVTEDVLGRHQWRHRPGRRYPECDCGNVGGDGCVEVRNLLAEWSALWPWVERVIT